MATENKDFKVKNGLQVGGPTNLVNYSSSSPSSPFLGQLWINETYLYAWSSASTWVLVGDGTASGGGPGGDYLTPAAASALYFPISSSVSNFGTIKTIPDTQTIEADLIKDQLTFAAENGIILNATASVDQLTISTNATRNNTASAIVMRDGSGTFSVGAVDFDTTASPALSVGRIQWNQDFGTPEVGLIGGNVTANIGQHVHAFVTNDEASSLVKGDVVYLFGATGNRASVKKAYNLSDTTSSKTLGVVAETIAAGQTGFVTVFGVVSNIDLSAYSPGDVLWLSASPGKFTTIKPSAPQHLVFVGIVERANPGNGQLFVNVQNGYELEELHSVSINSITDNDILSYNGSSSLWFNQNLAVAIQEVDGAGSGIDADLLDTHEASYFINTSNDTQEKTGTITFHGTVNIANLVVTGSSTTISSTNLAVTDSLIQLAHEQYTADAVDIGIVGSYGDGTTSSAGHYHASFARDASQNKWKLLSNGPAPANNVIDYTDPSVEFGILQIGALEVSSSAVVTNFNADLLDGLDSTYFQSAATASATFAPLNSPTFTGTVTLNASTTSNSNIEFGASALGIVLKSPNNTSYLVTVNDDGSLTTTEI